MQSHSLTLERLENRLALSADGLAAPMEAAAATEVVHVLESEASAAEQAPTTPAFMVLGDFNQDGEINATDIDMLATAIRQNGDSSFDLNSDGLINRGDMDQLVTGILNTHYGDANLDGFVDEVDSATLIRSWFSSDQGWSNGDFDGDEAIDGSDFGIWNANKFLVSERALGGGTRVPARIAADGGSERLTPIAPEPAMVRSEVRETNMAIKIAEQSPSPAVPSALELPSLSRGLKRDRIASLRMGGE